MGQHEAIKLILHLVYSHLLCDNMEQSRRDWAIKYLSVGGLEHRRTFSQMKFKPLLKIIRRALPGFVSIKMNGPVPERNYYESD